MIKIKLGNFTAFLPQTGSAPNPKNKPGYTFTKSAPRKVVKPSHK